MGLVKLTDEQMQDIRPGEALTLTTVFVVFTVVILTIVAYRLFVGSESKVSLPGGYKFEWEALP